MKSISSIPSPVYQWKNAFLLNKDVKFSHTGLKTSWIDVELNSIVPAIFRPFGGISHIEDWIFEGIHSIKYDELLFWGLRISSSTYFADIFPLKIAEAVKYLPWRGSAEHKTFLGSSICRTISQTVVDLNCRELWSEIGAELALKKWSLGKGTILTKIFLSPVLCYPGNLKEQVIPDIALETILLRSE